MGESTDNMEQIVKEEKTDGFYFKARYILCMLLTLGIVNVYSLRTGINVAILVMVDTSSNATTANNYSYESECNIVNETDSKDLQKGEFHWTISQQTLVIACYYYGYMIMNIPGALLAKRFGIRIVLGLAGLFSSALTLLIPVLTHQSIYFLIAIRTTVGLLQGVTFPTAFTTWGIWAPPLERSRLMSITMAGYSVGICLIFPLVGHIITNFGWEAVFYITGALGIIWSIAWLTLIHNTPEEHPRISPKERRYIQESLGTKQSSAAPPIPWKSILTSPVILSMFAANISVNWATLTLTSLGPMYLARVHGFNAKAAGFLSSLPFMLRMIMNVLWGMAADFIIKSKFLSILTVRKISSTLTLLLSSLAFIAVAYVGCNSLPVVILLAAAVGILGMATSGHSTSYLDVAPIYSGVIFSISNTINSGLGFAAPQIAGLLLVDNSLASWRNVFWLAACISALGGIVYGIFASARLQSWAKEVSEENKTGLLMKTSDIKERQK